MQPIAPAARQNVWLTGAVLHTEPVAAAIVLRNILASVLGLMVEVCKDSRMRALTVMFCFAVVSLKAVADPLSSADREALLGNLEKLRGTVTERVDSKYRAAISAYRSAMTSEGAALEFYLKCVEKVRFESQFKKASEFREWKKREDAKLSETSLRRALVHQLRWLVLTLQAASENADLGKLGTEGQHAIDDLFSDAATLASQHELLGQAVTSTVFVKAYEITGIKLEKWPPSPVDISGFYEEVILPRYRADNNVNGLRAAWTKRIHQEGVLHEPLVAKSKGNGRALSPESGRSPALKKFLAETLPDLQWQMEMDLFRCGDQRGAAQRMIAHIEKHLAHSHARAWSDDLKSALSPKPIVPPTDPAPKAAP